MKRAVVLRPASISEAVQAFAEHSRNARYLAGGTDVFVEESLRSERVFVSLGKLGELKSVYVDSKGALHIGSMVLISDLENYLRNAGTYTALLDGVSQIGSVQIRNVATIGGNICSSLPSADSIGPLLVHEARLSVWSEAGEEIIRMEDFCTGPGKNRMRPGDILKEIILPEEAGLSSAYVKHGRRKAMEIALVGASCAIQSDSADDVCKYLRVALTTSAPTHVRARQTEEYLQGKVLSPENIYEASLLANRSAKPRSSFRSTAQYRLSVIPVLVKAAIEAALSRGRS